MPRTSLLRSITGALFLLALAVASFSAAPPVSVRFIGSGTPDFVLEKARMQSGILVEVDGERWLLDAGAGVLARMFDHKIAPETLDHIFLSHLHFDHCIDLDAILFAWMFAGPAVGTPDRFDKRLPLSLWGPDGTEQMLKGLYENAYAVDGRGKRLLEAPKLKRTRNRDAGEVKTAKANVTFHEVKHVRMDCWAVRIETPRGVIVYSGDIGGAQGTGTWESQQPFAEWAKGADMLILDSLHLPPEVLGKIVETAAPKTVVYSHLAERGIPLFPHYDPKMTTAIGLAKKAGVKVVVAKEGMNLTL